MRLNSLLATYNAPTTNKTAASNNEQRSNGNQVQQRIERPRPRSIQLKPQEYFLLVVAALAISALVIYNLFMSYYEYYIADDDDDTNNNNYV